MMNAIKLNPYLYFNGQAREAMEFYWDVFGGQLFMQSRAEVGMEHDHPEWLIHCRLEGGDAELMASDTEQASAEARKIELSLMVDDDHRLRDIFEKLGTGGSIESPLKKEFWGDTFGKLTDRYGVIWMININSQKT